MDADDSSPPQHSNPFEDNSPGTKEDRAPSASDKSMEVFREVAKPFRCKPADLDVEQILFDVRNVQTLKTFLQLLLSDAEGPELDTLANFLSYVVYDLSTFDDLDVKYTLVVMYQAYVAQLYNKQTCNALIDLCDQFLQPDDNMIREEAYKLVAILLDLLDDDGMVEMLKLVSRTFDDEWNKCTGIDLMAICFHKLTEATQKEFRTQYASLLSDDSPLARTAMAKNYFKLVEHYRLDWIEGEAIETLNSLVDDIQVPVRVHAVRTAITIASLIEEDLVDKHLRTIFEKLSADTSWKVRLEVAARILEIQKAVKPKLARMMLIALLQTLCADRDTIVRKALALHVVDVVTHFKETTDIDLADVFEVINELNRDINDEVRNNLMSVIMDCAGVLSKDECKTFLLPLMKNTLMCQTITGLQKVQEQCVLNINKLISVLGYEVMQEEIEKFMFGVLSEDSQWRTRRRLIMTLNILALNSSEEYFTGVCLSFYKKMLNDACHSVRRIVPMLLPVLVGRFGYEWGMKHILNYIFSFQDHPTYFQRLLVCYSIEELVHPSLGHIKASRYEKTHVLSREMSKDYLYQVFSLNEMLKYKMDSLEVTIREEEYDPNVPSTDLVFYGEDMAEEFAALEIPSQDVKDLLTFIIKHIIPILINFLNDGVINVINRTIGTCRIILRLHAQIAREFLEDGYKDMLDCFDKDVRSTMESDILYKLTEVDGDMREKIEHPVRGQEFENNVGFVDALDSVDDDLGEAHSRKGMEDMTKELENELLKLEEFATKNLDTNENLLDEDDDNGNDNGHEESSSGSRTNGKNDNDNDNDNEVQKHLLDDVDMNLFDQKKTVLEFYSDASDAIDI